MRTSSIAIGLCNFSGRNLQGGLRYEARLSKLVIGLHPYSLIVSYNLRHAYGGRVSFVNRTVVV